jgi:uncharacterized alkaline shock family protein YloU
MEVFALYGQSGSGKSHHASLLANELGIRLIIDDGLAVMDGKILAGQSAKRESSRLAAVRRAIFAEPEHALLVREKIQQVRPARVLILGTSKTMVLRIAEALELPAPGRFIDIREVSSKEDIRRAMKIRREQGKHVIPAPTLEVKKTFAGYLIDPLRFLIPRKANRQTGSLIIEKSVVRPTWSSFGKFFIADSVVGAIAVRSAREAQGVARVRKVLVETSDDGVHIDLDIVLKYGLPPFDVLRDSQKRVKQMVEFCTALTVLAVDVSAKKMSLE